MNTKWLIGAFAMALLLVAEPSLASEAGTGLEWEGPLQAIMRSMTGPVAFMISFIAIVIAGAMLVWGGELNEFARRVVMLILVISLIMFAGSILRRLFVGGAATIAAPTAQIEVWRGASHE